VTGLFLLLLPAVPLALLLGVPEAPEGIEGNWIQTVPGKGWCMLFRLYGPGESWSDKTWRPGEIDLVES
jgi:hypothetical protein